MMKLVQSAALASVVVLLANACSRSSGGDDVDVPIDDVPKWHFQTMDHRLGEMTLTGVWANSQHQLFVVGWHGTILTNRREGVWEKMDVPTTEHLTAITGLNNGQRFGLEAHQGEMFAVGWNGTLLHYNPNADADPTTDDGAWGMIAGPTGDGLIPLMKPDPACPDHDGDGVADDGDGDGWVGNREGVQRLCAAGTSAACDDNCRETANGPLRPLKDTNTLGPDAGCLPGNPGCNIGCVGPGDVAEPTENQLDADGDGVGLVCDTDDFVGVGTPRLTAPLFALWARADGANLSVVAVGGDGAIVSFQGVSAAEPPPMVGFPVTDARAWLAQTAVPFRFSNDCDSSTPPGEVCAGSGRFPPSCPAQCNPIKTTCDCPVGSGQCCDSAASTGVGCGDGSCGAAPNACDGANCSSLCPACFRRLDNTLRGIAVDGDRLVAVGSQGMIAVGDRNDPNDVWTVPGCAAPPKPLDDRPLFMAIGGAGGNFHVVGAGGLVFRSSGTGDCPFEIRGGAPPGMLAAVLPMGGNTGYAVGDEGLFVRIEGGSNPPVQVIETELDHNLMGLARVIEVNPEGEDAERFFFVGAEGTIVKAGFY